MAVSDCASCFGQIGISECHYSKIEILTFSLLKQQQKQSYQASIYRQLLCNTWVTYPLCYRNYYRSYDQRGIGYMQFVTNCCCSVSSRCRSTLQGVCADVSDMGNEGRSREQRDGRVEPTICGTMHRSLHWGRQSLGSARTTRTIQLVNASIPEPRFLMDQWFSVESASSRYYNADIVLI